MKMNPKCYSSYKKLSFFAFIFFLSFYVMGENPSQPEPTVYTLTTDEIAKKPIGPLLYGNFIELGYGMQVEAMWGEMFFNRSFEAFYPYREINKIWCDLYYDERDWSKGYEADWSKFDWYHSGYEHNSWFAAPGVSHKPSVIVDSSTFIQRTTPERKIILQPLKGGSGHGTQCLKISNEETSRWGAVAQSGKWLQKGATYLFSGMMKSEKGRLVAEIQIYPEGNWDNPILTIPVEIADGKFTKRTVEIENHDFTGYATFSLWIPPQSSIEIDDFSMKPEDSYYGWRKDVVEAFKKVNPQIVRFPGGCFASFYNWRDGIGSYSERVPLPSYFWGGLNYNDVGTAEYAMLCKSAGAEMQICVNVYHPSKRRYDIDFPNGQGVLSGGFEFPGFMSLTEGAQSAADWLAYCNSKAGENPMADLRVQHGYPEPFGVKYWEMDNEVHRWFEPKDYAWAVVVYSKAMKAVDPTIKIGMASYGGRPGKKDYHSSFEDMLEIAGPYIDFIADRADGETISAMMLEKVRKYNAEHGTHIQYCDTEWLAYNTDEKRDLYNMASRNGETTKSYAFSKWYYALNLARNFMAFQRLGDDVGFVNFNNLANTHSQCAMDTPKEGAFLTASGEVLKLFSRSPAAYVVDIRDYHPRESDDFQVQAAWDATRQKMILYICNRTDSANTPEFDLSALKKQFKKATIARLSANSPLAMNTFENQDAIRHTDNIMRVKGNILRVKAPAYSFSQIVIE